MIHSILQSISQAIGADPRLAADFNRICDCGTRRMRSSRRRFLGTALLTLNAFAPALSLAQMRPVRIGYLVGRKNSRFLPGILKRLGVLGCVEGKNLV